MIPKTATITIATMAPPELADEDLRGGPTIGLPAASGIVT
jgi:hypothetical protein